MEHDAKKKSASFKLLRVQSWSPVRYSATGPSDSTLDAGKSMINSANSINFMYGSLSKKGINVNWFLDNSKFKKCI